MRGSIGKPARFFQPQRRRVLLGAASCLSAAALADVLRVPDNRARPRALIDVHHHAHTLELAHWWGRDKLDPAWTVSHSLETMDANGVSTAFLSITQPGVWKVADADGSVSLARECNEQMARAASDHPGRFGFFTALAAPKIDASLAEIGYAFDELKADGVGLLSSYDGRYLGDPAFAPLIDELDRRGAVVYVHPGLPACCTNVLPGVPAGGLEVPTDTTRTIESLLFSGTLARATRVRFIFAHGGGTLPFLAERILGVPGLASADKPYMAPEALRAALQRVYVDTASVANAPAWAALMAFTSVSQVLFGTDHPYQSVAANLGGLRAMEQRSGLGAADREAIEFGNAARLFPTRLAALAARA